MDLNSSLITTVCQLYNLGEVLSQPTHCLGGLLHQNYLLKTSKGQFVIKCLNSIICSNNNDKEMFRSTEHIAEQLSSSICAVKAIKLKNDILTTIADQTIMVFPYIEAAIIPQDKVTTRHVTTIATALAKIHNAAIIQSGLSLSMQLDLDLLINCQDKIKRKCPEITEELAVFLPSLNFILEQCRKSESLLAKNLAVSHRDLDPKNVLWDAQDNYYIIDWEYAGLINKTKDVISTAIYWSLKPDFKIDLNSLVSFIKQYEINSTTPLNRQEIEAAFYGLLADWLLWVELNFRRIVNDTLSTDERNLGIKEATRSLRAIPIVLGQFTEIVAMIQ